MGREVGTGLHRIVAAPAATLYGILTDTDRFDRITGVTPSRYTFELLDPHDPTSRTRIGHAKNGMFPIHFAEEGEYWIGSFLRGERRFRGGLARWVRRGFFEVRCEETGPDTTKLDVRVGLEPTWIGWLLVPYLIMLNRRILRRYVSAVARLAEATVSARRPAPDEPPAIHARYALAAHFENRGVNGPRTLPTPLLDERLERFRKAPISDRVRERVIRCGCNEGPCFIVRANDRVDLFGSTINLAARLSGVAGGQQLAMLATLADSLRETLANEPCEIEPVTSAIKGVQGQLSLSVVTYKGHAGTAAPRLARLKTDPAGLSG